jgi:hypothetical protein
MHVDRYTKLVLTVIAGALVALAVRLWWSPGSWATVGPVAAEAQGVQAKYEVSLPRSWGKLVGFSNNNLLLEAPDQTLRVVDVEGRPPEYPKVKVLVRWQ